MIVGGDNIYSFFLFRKAQELAACLLDGSGEIINSLHVPRGFA